MSNFGNNNKDNGGGFLGYRYFIDAAQKWRNNKKYKKQYKKARNNKTEAFKMESEYIANSFNDIKNLIEKHYNDNNIVKNDKKTISSIVDNFLTYYKKENDLKNFDWEEYGIKEKLLNQFEKFVTKKYGKSSEEVKQNSNKLLEAYIDNKGEKDTKVLLGISSETLKLVEDFKVIRKALGILKKYINNSDCFKEFLKKPNMNEGWDWLDNKYSVSNKDGKDDNLTMFNQLDYYCKLVVYFANSDYNWFQQQGDKAAYFKQCFENQLNLINRLQENFNVYNTNLYYELNKQQSNNGYSNDDGGSDDSYPHNQNDSLILIGGSDNGYINTNNDGDNGLRVTVDADELNRQDITFNPESEEGEQQVDMTFNPEDTSGTMSNPQNNNNRGRKSSNLYKAKQRFQQKKNDNKNRTGRKKGMFESIDYIVDNCIRQFIIENKKDNQ